MPQIIARVTAATDDAFRLQNLPTKLWKPKVEDCGRVEVGDVVCIEVPDLPFPLVDESQVEDRHTSNFSIVRVNKGGNPAFQG